VKGPNSFRAIPQELIPMKKHDSFSGVFRLAAVLILGLLLFPARGWSQDFPNKPITIYCGFEAGATTDLTARALAEEGQKALGVKTQKK
jgi:tripartite-type tricarboxylate transporter receptor subunit TctC